MFVFCWQRPAAFWLLNDTHRHQRTTKTAGTFFSGHQRVQTVRIAFWSWNSVVFACCFLPFFPHNHMVQWEQEKDGLQDELSFQAGEAIWSTEPWWWEKGGCNFSSLKKKRLPPFSDHFGSWLSHLEVWLMKFFGKTSILVTRLADVCKCYSNKQKGKKNERSWTRRCPGLKTNLVLQVIWTCSSWVVNIGNKDHEGLNTWRNQRNIFTTTALLAEYGIGAVSLTGNAKPCQTAEL